MNTQVNHALDVQEELKIIAAQLFEIWGETDYEQFGWNVELTKENWIDPDIWVGNNYVVDPSQEERGESLINVKSLIGVSEFKRKDDGLYHVVVEVDFPDEYNLPITSFECDYEFVDGEPMQGFPHAMYEAYKYFDEVTVFSYGEKLSYLTGAMWEFARGLGFLGKPDHFEEHARFIKADIVE